MNWIFTPQAVASYETLVDQTLVLFLKELGDRFAGPRQEKVGGTGTAGGGGGGATFDMSEWLAYFAFDFIGDLTYNRRYGFVQEGRDVDGIIASLPALSKYGAYVCTAAFCLMSSRVSRSKVKLTDVSTLDRSGPYS